LQELSLVILEIGILFKLVIVLAGRLARKAGRVVNRVCCVIVVHVLTEGSSLFRRLIPLCLRALHVVVREWDFDLSFSDWLLILT
jgi:hypothetical protein